MPINKSGARLWFKTKEEEEAYDDKMVSNIELKSLNFDDENFSPVFDRSKQEFFLKPGKKFIEGFEQRMSPLRSLSHDAIIDKYVLIPPNHTYWRSFTIEKFLSGFAFGYIVLRELPIRNFYARCLVMWAFAAKLMDHFGSPFPQLYPQGTISLERDRWTFDNIKVFDRAMEALQFTEIPTNNNQIRESKKWHNKQPGHMIRADMHNIGQWIGRPFKKRHEAFWDGTMNMPIHRLADPKHRDASSIRFW